MKIIPLLMTLFVFQLGYAAELTAQGKPDSNAVLAED